jgi:hypothetical protein
MAEKTLYVIKIKKSGRWRDTSWTRQGKPVSKRAAVKALARAQKDWPDEEYRIAEVK